MKFMDSNLHLLLPNHYFCMRCDQKEFCGTEINENLIIDEKAGDLICGQCGEILKEKLIYQGNETVLYSEEMEIGNNHSSRVSGHSHFFGCEESVFVEGPEELRLQLERAQKLLQSRKEKTITSNIPLVNDLCIKLNLTVTIKVKAVEIFTSYLVEQTVLKHLPVFAAVSVYLACRVGGYPRLLDEISLASGVDVKLLMKYQGVIARKLALPIGMIKPRDIINRMTVQLDWSFIRRQLAFDFCEEIHQYDLFMTSPPQLVAAVIISWLSILTTEVAPSSSSSSSPSASIRRPLLTSVEDICRVCFIPPGALKKLFREFFPYLVNIVPKELSEVVSKYSSQLSPQIEKHLDEENHFIPVVPLPEPVVDPSLSTMIPLQKSGSGMSRTTSSSSISSNQSKKRKINQLSS